MRFNGAMTRRDSIPERFGSATRRWFTGAFAAPTPAQLGAWQAISAGANTLVIAPTGSGKTLAAFLWAIDRLAAARAAGAPHGTRVLYISPLKALGVDVERNLSAPLAGIGNAAALLGETPPEITVGVRSGDTPAAARRALLRTPPDILITTPESLYLMLTSAARETLTCVDTVIVDEVHAVAGTKRGTHLALSLERLDAQLPRPAQRIGLSATVEPAETVAEFLSGSRPAVIVRPPAAKTFDLRVQVPVEDMANIPAPAGPDHLGTAAPGDGAFSPTAGSLWPHVESAIVDLVEANRSTIVFANSRRLAERLTASLNEIAAARAGTPVDHDLRNPLVPGGRPSFISTGDMSGAPHLLARAHHGSVSMTQRAEIEDDLKSGRLRCVVATSSLELGIDMGAVDLVIQVEAPPSVAAGLQRIGRAGHQVGEVSQGVLFPKHRTDLIHCTVTAQRMRDGAIESITVPSNPLDVLAQQTIAQATVGDLNVDEWFDVVRRATPYRKLPRSAYEATLDLISGRYPSDEFAELRPRLDWDRHTGTLSARRGAQRLAVTSGGTIPDRGQFGVFLVSSDDGGAPRRVGELDEQMVYESRVGDVFALGASSWRVEEITPDRVIVSPAFGRPGRLPFWVGDTVGRPAELGAAIGTFLRKTPDDAALAAQSTTLGLTGFAEANLASLLAEQRDATGALPTDRTLVVERFRDELGDWRVILHSPYGLRVHAPWASAVAAALSQRLGIDGATTATDDGIIVRLPDTDDTPPGAELFDVDPDHVEAIVTAALADSSLFAARFRECAARALLLPRRDPGRRSPLWQQRQRASQLLAVAIKYPDFPIVLEAVRECLTDVYDLPSLIDLLTRIRTRRIRLVDVETPAPSPFAAALLLGYTGSFIYDDDAPIAERRAAALALDTTLLAELLGRVDLRELLDPGVIETTLARLQRLDPQRQARDAQDVADLLRWLGPLEPTEIADRYRGEEPLPRLLDTLTDTGRILELSHRGRLVFAAVEDAARLRDALGIPIPPGVPAAFTEPVADPLGDLVHRYARTHGPFTTAQVAERLGIGPAVAGEILERLAGARTVIEGAFVSPETLDVPPGRSVAQWCHTDVLTQLRRGSLAAGRAEIEPVDGATFARFLQRWQQVGTGDLRGAAGVAAAIEQLAGYPVPASAVESLILPARVTGYTPAMLDELLASGEVVWSGHGRIGAADGWVAFHLADALALTLPPPDDVELTATHTAVLEALDGAGGLRYRDLSGAGAPGPDIETALWDLVFSGHVSNDSFSVVRALLRPGRSRGSQPPVSAHRVRGTAPRLRSARLSSRYLTGAGPEPGSPLTGGRWFALARGEVEPTTATAATCDILLDRYGVVTKGSVVATQVEGGFSRIYKALSVFEDNGQVRRGYFIDGLGGAQFAAGSTVDLLRESACPPEHPVAVVLAATDPANPYGAALAWPDRGDDPGTSGHRPGRKPGALVVLVGGEPAVFVERGGKRLLTFTDDPDVLAPAAAELADAVRRSAVPRMHVDQVDGERVLTSPFGELLVEHGFARTPRGIRMKYTSG